MATLFRTEHFTCATCWIFKGIHPHPTLNVDTRRTDGERWRPTSLMPSRQEKVNYICITPLQTRGVWCHRMRSQQTRPVPFFYFSRTPPSEKQPPLSTSQTKDKKSKEKYRFLSGWKNNTPKRRRKCLLFDLLRTPFFSFLFLPPTTSATAIVSFLSLPTISRPPASVETGRHVHFLSLVLFFSASYCVVKWRVITAMLVWREKKWNVWSSFSCARLCPMATISRVTWYTSSRRYRGWLISASFSFCLSLTRPFSVSCRHRFQDGDAQFFKHFSRKDLAAEPSGRRRFYFT